MEWAIEVALETGKPVGATMCIGPTGDENQVPVGECAIRFPTCLNGLFMIKYNNCIQSFAGSQPRQNISENL